MACCECPADFEMSVPMLTFSSVLKNSTTCTTPKSYNVRKKINLIESKSFLSCFLNY